MTDEKPGLWALAGSVYLPSLLYSIGQGAIIPVLALAALELHGSIGLASIVVAAAGLGRVIGDIPAGALATRLGERNAMLAAVVVVLLALLACIAATEVWVFAGAVFVVGMGTAVWGLARASYIAEMVPYELRGRAYSTMGGVQRMGTFIGPLFGAIAIKAMGTDGAFWVHVVAVVAAGIALAALPTISPDEGAETAGTTTDVLRRHLPVLRTLGVAGLMVSAARISRQAVIPLWAAHLGLSPITATLIFGISGAADLLLFYPGGKLMDRHGRAFVGVPATVLMGCAYLSVPFTATAVQLTIAAVVAGAGNGLTSGLIMTIGADSSPRRRSSEVPGHLAVLLRLR